MTRIDANGIPIISEAEMMLAETPFTDAELIEIQWQLKRYEWHDLDAKQSALKKVTMILILFFLTRRRFGVLFQTTTACSFALSDHHLHNTII